MRLRVVAVTLPALVLAGRGLSHPHDLTGATAQWWTILHMGVVPLFPLLGVAHWVLLRGERGVIAWISRIAAFLYVAFYAVTDHIVGIGTGPQTRHPPCERGMPPHQRAARARVTGAPRSPAEKRWLRWSPRFPTLACFASLLTTPTPPAASRFGW